MVSSNEMHRAIESCWIRLVNTQQFSIKFWYNILAMVPQILQLNYYTWSIYHMSTNGVNSILSISIFFGFIEKRNEPSYCLPTIFSPPHRQYSLSCWKFTHQHSLEDQNTQLFGLNSGTQNFQYIKSLIKKKGKTQIYQSNIIY